jgi:hypothetical protein
MRPWRTRVRILAAAASIADGEAGGQLFYPAESVQLGRP